MPPEPVRFSAAGEDGPVLEGELWLPDGDGQVSGVVVSHPHPLRGGSMESNVVVAICLGLWSTGIGCLRFNFRGVGRSEGQHGNGVDEVNDVLGAMSFLESQPRIAAGSVGLAGYSFGARVSLATAPLVPDIQALLCVAPPLNEPLAAGSIPCRYLVIVGDRDGNLSAGVERYASCLPEPDHLQVVRGTDHFWRGYESVLAEASRKFFAEHLPATAAEIAP